MSNPLKFFQVLSKYFAYLLHFQVLFFLGFMTMSKPAFGQKLSKQKIMRLDSMLTADGFFVLNYYDRKFTKAEKLRMKEIAISQVELERMEEHELKKITDITIIKAVDELLKEEFYPRVKWAPGTLAIFDLITDETNQPMNDLSVFNLDSVKKEKCHMRRRVHIDVPCEMNSIGRFFHTRRQGFVRSDYASFSRTCKKKLPDNTSSDCNLGFSYLISILPDKSANHRLSKPRRF
jgi:hypothetical protein